MGLFHRVEKTIAYKLPDKPSEKMITHIQEVDAVWKLHASELQIWAAMGDKGFSHRQNLVEDYLGHLKTEYPVEYKEIMGQPAFGKVGPKLFEFVQRSFCSGYMLGKGWINREQMAHFNILLGDLLAVEVKNVMPGAKSRGMGFGAPFSKIAAKGFRFTNAPT